MIACKHCACELLYVSLPRLGRGLRVVCCGCDRDRSSETSAAIPVRFEAGKTYVPRDALTWGKLTSLDWLEATRIGAPLY